MNAPHATSSGLMPLIFSASSGRGADSVARTSRYLLTESIEIAATARAAIATNTARQCTTSASTADNETPATMLSVQPVSTTPIVLLSRPGGATAAALE